ncbi:hypothetical protein BCR44DRAFT_35222 [Catenaria anguillulae PL171]|uniref:Uncharacterized protein n=1 Tax=Catenaria anguillulae PL171 TaxID=765915 RepID=A0A1Y2H495_9FUNG|nr:hypothetical protein BCR44DRAFT_35222 [Catenaria anguillulae PL171]
MSSHSAGAAAVPPPVPPPLMPDMSTLPLGTYLSAVASDLLPWLHHGTTMASCPDSIIKSLPVPVRTVGTLLSSDPSEQSATLSLAQHDLTPLSLQRQQRTDQPPMITVQFDLVPAMAGFPLGSTVDVCGELKLFAVGEDRDATLGIQVRFACVVDGMDVRLWAATALAVRKAWAL